MGWGWGAGAEGARAGAGGLGLASSCPTCTGYDPPASLPLGPQPIIRRPLGTAWLVSFQTQQMVVGGGVGVWDRELASSPQPPPKMKSAKYA